MKILIACEYSGRVRDAFHLLGHYVVSCDILPCESKLVDGKHYKGDVLDILYDNWDMMIAFPPCTYLSSSGLHWNKRVPERAEKTEQAIEFVSKLLTAPIEKIALENPIGCISSRIRKPNQIIQPWQFGEDSSKSTCLWLKNLPELQTTREIKPRIVDGKKRWGNQTDSGQNRLGPSEDRAKIRSLTYEGIANAMAIQWG